MKKNTKLNNTNSHWVPTAFALAFILSIMFSGVSNLLIPRINILLSVVLLLIIISIGILFDMVGTAVASSSETPFHSKAAKNHIGAKKALYMIKHTEKVASICNDVIGDICGIISGSVSAMIALRIGMIIDPVIAGLLISAIVASLTVGGKAIGKTYSIKNGIDIIYKVGALMEVIKPTPKKNEVAIKNKEKTQQRINKQERNSNKKNADEENIDSIK